MALATPNYAAQSFDQDSWMAREEGLGGREALAVSLTNISEMSGRPELVTLFTTMLRSGEVFYLIEVAPQDESQDYQRTFMAVLGTLSIND